MHIGLVTLFPEMFSAITDYGITSRAFRNSLIKLSFCNPRNYTNDRHCTVDDKPFGGGPGMLMKTEPLQAAVEAATAQVFVESQPKPKVVYLSPQGRRLTQENIVQLAQRKSMVLVCGRYQGIDARLIDNVIDEEWSLGDFVLSGGELAAMALIDAMTRYQPGALGDEDSARQDSFANGLLHCPEYTRPAVVAGSEVPAVLLSGDHTAIRRWRLKQSLGSTWLKRPDLLKDLSLNQEQKDLLAEYVAENQHKE